MLADIFADTHGLTFTHLTLLTSRMMLVKLMHKFHRTLM
jgi:hypothetical protein